MNRTKVDALKDLGEKITGEKINIGENETIVGVLDKITEHGGSSGSSENYSTTEEQVVGTWINGKPLYQKVFSGTLSATTATSKASSTTIPLDNAIDFGFITEAFSYTTSGNTSGLLITNDTYPYMQYDIDEDNEFQGGRRVSFRPSSHLITLKRSEAGASSALSVYVIARYTKSTD